MTPRTTLAAVLAALLVLFTVQNHEVVDLRFLFWNVEAPRVLMFLGIFSVGAFFGWLAGRRDRPRR